MSIIGSNILAGAAGSGVSAYEIEQSLRFNGSDSAYLINSTPSTDGNRKTYTISVWVKKVVNSGTGGDTFFYATADASNIYAFTSLSFGNADAGHNESLRFLASDSGASQYKVRESSTAAYRDYSAWMHVVAVMDTTQSTAADRAKIYVNGEQITDLTSTLTEPAQDYQNYVNGNNAKVQIGRNFNEVGQGPWYFDGYLAEYHLVDGTALEPTDFGEYDKSGVWRPIAYTGSHGTNGFYLKFDPSATNGIGHDHSGNGNNFTASGFTTSGTGTDVMDDTPTNNFATLNPLIGYQAGGLLAPTFSDGNLTVAPQVDSNNNSRVASATLARNPADGGVWRWEMVVNSTNNSFYGIMALNENTGQGSFGPYWGASGLGGTLSTSGGASGSLQEQHATISAGDVITIVVSFDDNEIGWYINGTRDGFYNGCNFSNYDQLVPIFKESTRTQTPCTFDVNFGQKAFQYTTSGDAWGDLSTLPAPDIADGSDYFDTVLWTGDGSSPRSISGLEFSPDFVWYKSRSNAYSNTVYDIVRGAGNDKTLLTNTTAAEATAGGADYGYLSAFDSTGFTLTEGDINFAWGNASSATYVAWNWLAGGSGSSNTDGSITSTVSANPSAGFSIVSYTGTGSNATVGHGLGVAPKMIIVKDRDASIVWAVHHSDINIDNYLRLNTADGEVAGLAVWNQTAPTSTVFSIGISTIVNNTNDYIAYCFAEVEGYSKFGSYTGNGNADGPFIATSFSPSWIMVKRTDSADTWNILDDKRGPINPNQNRLYADLDSAESGDAGARADFLSNGFKLRTTNGDMNGSGGTYIFMALAENPFGGSGVSPATAR